MCYISISGDIDVIIQNGKELIKKDNKKVSSANPEKLFEEVYYSKLKDQITHDIKENLNVIIQKQLKETGDKHIECDDRLLEFIQNHISSLKDKLDIKHKFFIRYCARLKVIWIRQSYKKYHHASQNYAQKYQILQLHILLTPCPVKNSPFNITNTPNKMDKLINLKQ